MENELSRRKGITFAQAEGAAALPEQLKLGQVSTQLRALVWRHIYHDLARDIATAPYMDDMVEGQWREVLAEWHVNENYKFADEIDWKFNVQGTVVKNIIKIGDYIAFYGFLQFILRNRSVRQSLKFDIETALIDARSAYSVVDGDTILPMSTEEEGYAVTAALEIMSQIGASGARSHLKDAGACLTNGDFAGSIRESIHSVESIALILAPDAKRELGPALTVLEKNGHLHGSLKSAFLKLYGYSSDEGGIRHAKAFSDVVNVTQADALFMLGACASFVTYLLTTVVAESNGR